jgi:hypothetical protein
MTQVPVEADHHRQPTRHGRALESPHRLQPAHEQFHVDAAGALGAPVEENVKIRAERFGVQSVVVQGQGGTCLTGPVCGGAWTDSASWEPEDR